MQTNLDMEVFSFARSKPYFYFICRTGAAADRLQERVKALCIVLDGEYICQNFAL